MRTSISAIAAMIAAASFGGSALADGDYYEGASKTQVSAQVSSHASGRLDTFNTGSIAQVRSDEQSDAQSVFPHTSRDNR